MPCWHIRDWCSIDLDEPDESDADSTPGDEFADEMAAIRSALDGLRFGVVTITVQDGTVVQIERTEKQRLKFD